MNTIYILIIFWTSISANHEDPKAIESIEFNSLSHCQTAATALERKVDSRTRLVMICAAKGQLPNQLPAAK